MPSENMYIFPYQNQVSEESNDTLMISQLHFSFGAN